MPCWRASRRWKRSFRDTQRRLCVLRLAARPAAEYLSQRATLRGCCGQWHRVGVRRRPCRLMGALADELLCTGVALSASFPSTCAPRGRAPGLDRADHRCSMHTRSRRCAAQRCLYRSTGRLWHARRMFEMLTWLQLRCRPKPVGLLNVEGYLTLCCSFWSMQPARVDQARASRSAAG